MKTTTINQAIEKHNKKMEKEFKKPLRINPLQEECILKELAHNTGTTQYFKIPFSEVVYTDGISDLINKCSCYWLISDIAILKQFNKLGNGYFFTIKIELNQNTQGCVLSVLDWNTDEVVYKKVIGYTDFPLNKFEFYLKDNCFLLPSED